MPSRRDGVKRHRIARPYPIPLIRSRAALARNPERVCPTLAAALSIRAS
jgi:hypothetical protein